MTRAEILADVLAHLEAERFAPVEPQQACGPEPITPEQAAHHRQILHDATSDDPVVVAYIERQARAS